MAPTGDDLGTQFERQASGDTSADLATQFQRQASGDTVWTAFSVLEEDEEPSTPLRNMPDMRKWDKVAVPKVLKEHYKMKEHLGTGSFASVLVGEKRQTKERFAIKILPLDKLKAQGLVDVDNETVIAGQMQHANMVYLHESFKDDENMYLVMELCKGGDLYDHVKRWPHDPDEHNARLGLPVDMVGTYTWQMTSGLAYLHHNLIVHRDIKCENYLLKSRQRGSPIKLLDFGFACKAQPGQSIRERIGTPLYMAPEVQNGCYNEKCDIYGVGVCAFYLCTASFPFGNEKMGNEQIFAEAAAGKLTMDPKVWADVPDDLAKLIKRFLSLDVNKRPSAKEVMSDPNAWLRRNGYDPKQDMSADSEPHKQACCVIC